jgi:hypothetical protein
LRCLGVLAVSGEAFQYVPALQLRSNRLELSTQSSPLLRDGVYQVSPSYGDLLVLNPCPFESLLNP